MRKTDVMAYFNGNGAAVARAIGYTRSAVQQWPDPPGLVPEAAAYRLERATGGDLKVDPALYQTDLKQSA
jgi:DNA-binding transcriptional regulator YdaS (Cro superfamily)